METVLTEQNTASTPPAAPPAAAASETFKNPLEVHRYLKGQDWKISQAGLYKHLDEGKLVRNEAGAFGKIAVDKYARTFLKKKDGSKKGSEVLRDLQQDKVRAETRAAVAKATHLEHLVQKEKGELVPILWAVEQLAARAAFFKSDDENWCHSAAGDILAQAIGYLETVTLSAMSSAMTTERLENAAQARLEAAFSQLFDGLAGMEPDLIEFLLSSRERIFARYADTNLDYKVPPSPSALTDQAVQDPAAAGLSAELEDEDL